MRILHISAHYGGGVGTVISEWVTQDVDNIHVLFTLGFTHANIKKFLNKNNISLHDEMFYKSNHFLSLKTLIKNVDIVIVHYWNHPALMQLLTNFDFPECRLIVWSHSSGKKAPYVIPEKLYDFADQIIHTSYSSKNSVHNTVIRSTGNIDKFLEVVKKDHDNFNLLYVGTLDYSKMRSDFIKICYEISLKIPSARFTICGHGSAEESLKELAKGFNIYDKFNFTGRVDNVIPYLEVADIFLYPLDANHFGTGEQVLGEAMASGVVPVVFNNPSEMEVVTNGYNGIVAFNIQECINSIYRLYSHYPFYNELSKNAKENAKELYCIDNMIDKWQIVFNDAMKLPIQTRSWDKELLEYSKGINLFTESLGNENRLFIDYLLIKKQLIELLKSNNQWKSDTKGSINHYLEYFKDDEDLKDLQKLINKEN